MRKVRHRALSPRSTARAYEQWSWDLVQAVGVRGPLKTSLHTALQLLHLAKSPTSRSSLEPGKKERHADNLQHFPPRTGPGGAGAVRRGLTEPPSSEADSDHSDAAVANFPLQPIMASRAAADFHSLSWSHDKEN